MKRNRTLIRLLAFSLSVYPFLNVTALECFDTMSWLWWSNKAYAVDETTGPRIIPNTYSFALSQAVEVFKNTNLKPGQGPNGERKVKFVSGSLGYFESQRGLECGLGP